MSSLILLQMFRLSLFIRVRLRRLWRGWNVGLGITLWCGLGWLVVVWDFGFPAKWRRKIWKVDELRSLFYLHAGGT